ncbi:hypothetical protein [Azospirillum sp. sgz301742]
MLGFRWIAQHAGAPDAPAYRTAADELNGFAGESLQTLPKPDTALPEPSQALKDYVGAWVAKRGTGRAVVMVHGFDFDPSSSDDDPGNADDPYNGVYANPTVSGRESWLPIVGETDEAGNVLADIAVAFCWTSIGSMKQYGSACWCNLYQYPVFDLAPLASKALAAIIRALAEAGVPVDIFAHSLGTRTATEAIQLLAANGFPNAVRRVLLVGGAQFSVDARDALAGAQADVFSFASQSDPVLKWGGTTGCHPYRYVNTQPARVIGRDGMQPTPNWIDLQVDRTPAQQSVSFNAWFQTRYGATLCDTPDERGAHWAYYRQPGNRVVLAKMLVQDGLSPQGMRAAGVIEGVVRSGGYGDLTVPVPATPMTCAGRMNPPNLLVADADSVNNLVVG